MIWAGGTAAANAMSWEHTCSTSPSTPGDFQKGSREKDCIGSCGSCKGFGCCALCGWIKMNFLLSSNALSVLLVPSLF